MASAIRIAVLANASQAKKELATVEGRGQKMSKVLNAGSKVAAVGLAGLGVAAFKASKAAAEDEAGQSRLAQTLKTAAGATKGQIAPPSPGSPRRARPWASLTMTYARPWPG
jgi:hypothetical protein